MGLTRIRAQQITDIDYKQAVRVVSTNNVNLSGGAPISVDGVTLVNGNRILVTGQTNKAQNGLYQVQTLGTGETGTWIRTADANETGEIDPGMVVMVTEGTLYGDTLWKLVTNGNIQIGTTELTFVLNTQFGFGNISANSTSISAAVQSDTLTLTAGNNIAIVGNASSKSITFSTTNNLTVTGNIVGANISGNGAALTALNASNIASGTLPSARLSGSYAISVTSSTTSGTVTTAAQPNITSVGTLTSLSVTGNTTTTNLNTRSQGEIRFFDSDNSNYVAFRSAGTVTGNVTWTLPVADGTVGQLLATDGAGNLAWVTGGTGGGGITWTTQANTPPVVAAPGDFWYDSASQIKYQYINDGTGNAWVDQSFPTVFETVTTGAIINSNANGVGNIGTSSGYFNTVFAKATSAQYADLAEIYSSDADYAPGTVVVFGGTEEVTVSTEECDTRVAGVVSTDPAYMMNMGADGVMVALTGRVPCQVRGPVTKGDVLITSNIPGTAQRIGNRWLPGCVIGKSLETIEDDSVKTIEVAVGRF